MVTYDQANDAADLVYKTLSGGGKPEWLLGVGIELSEGDDYRVLVRVTDKGQAKSVDKVANGVNVIVEERAPAVALDLA